MTEKQELRKIFSAKRGALPPGEKERLDDAVSRNTLVFCEGYGSVFVYNSFGSETDTKKIVADLLAAGKRVYLPKIVGGEMFAAPYGGAVTGAYGIEEPETEPYAGDIDLALVPLLAINPKGFRLGYGKGFYDRFLSGRRIVKMGLLYSFQETCLLEETEGDVPMDGAITELGVHMYAED
ncbi:MAG: 5-formyltetrahydrofolate cyclo-ligase [Clostridia bacterium]|nr:5-formyltetrahydrofolate cyclo-ligase [Clostridia bacterium]